MATNDTGNEKKMLEWLGGEYDVGHFDKDEINQELASLDSYIKDIKKLRDGD